jgi:hypothetical protein
MGQAARWGMDQSLPYMYSTVLLTDGKLPVTINEVSRSAMTTLLTGAAGGIAFGTARRFGEAGRSASTTSRPLMTWQPRFQSACTSPTLPPPSGSLKRTGLPG